MLVGCPRRNKVTEVMFLRSSMTQEHITQDTDNVRYNLKTMITIFDEKRNPMKFHRKNDSEQAFLEFAAYVGKFAIEWRVPADSEA